MNLYALSGDDFGGSLIGRRQSENQEGFIIGNPPVLTLTRFGQP